LGAQIILLCAATTAALAFGSRGSPVGDGYARARRLNGAGQRE